MSYQVLYQKIVKYLSRRELSWVIIDFFTHQQLVAFMEKIGITYPGVRMISVSYQQLSEDLSEDVLQNSCIAQQVIEKINSLSQDYNGQISQMHIEHIENYLFRHTKDIYLEAKIGKMLWALLNDSRPQANEKIPKFIKAIDKIMDEEKKLFEDAKANIPKFSNREYKKLSKMFSKMEERIKQESRFAYQVQQENARLNQRLEVYQRRISEIQKDYGNLSHEKGILNKSIEKKDKEIQVLLRQVEALKSRMQSDPKIRLKNLLHQLEKENEKLIYDLEKDRKDHIAKVSDLEKRIASLEQELNTDREISQLLKEQLDSQKQKVLQLEKERQLILPSEKPIYLKEKGKRVGVFIDAQNVYYSAKAQFNKKLDYRELLVRLVRDRHLVKAICYIVRHPDIDYEGFIGMLKANGYTVRTRDLIKRADGTAKGNWDIGMAADVIQMVDKNSLDIVVLVTCDGDFADLIKVLNGRNIRVEVAGFPLNTAVDLKRLCDDFYSIDEDLMLKEHQETKI